MLDTYFTVCGIVGAAFAACILLKSLSRSLDRHNPTNRRLTKEQRERMEREREAENKEMGRKIDETLARHKEWERARGWDADA